MVTQFPIYGTLAAARALIDEQDRRHERRAANAVQVQHARTIASPRGLAALFPGLKGKR